jgi:hypothetical protein
MERKMKKKRNTKFVKVITGALLATAVIWGGASADHHTLKDRYGKGPLTLEAILQARLPMRSAQMYTPGLITTTEFIGTAQDDADGKHLLANECFSIRQATTTPENTTPSIEKYRLRIVPCDGSPGTNWDGQTYDVIQEDPGYPEGYIIKDVMINGESHDGALLVQDRDPTTLVPTHYVLDFDYHAAGSGGSHPGHGTVK